MIWNFHIMSIIRERKMEGEQKETELLNGEKRGIETRWGRYTGVIRLARRLGKQAKESNRNARNAGERGKISRGREKVDEDGQSLRRTDRWAVSLRHGAGG